jgi:vitamin K-dependent gamma-carboxylase
MSGIPTNRRQPEVDGSSLAAVRIVFGIVGALAMVRLLVYGWVETLYAGPDRHFTYPGLRFVRDPGLVGTYALVVIVGLAACAIAFGLRTRVALIVFLLGFSWIEFIDVTTYLNHYWFVTLIGGVMLFAPIDTTMAVNTRPRPVAAGWIRFFRFHVAMVYAFAGLAKLNEDWLVHAVPLRLWLPARSGLPLVGAVLEQGWTAVALSWAGALFDCSIVVLLCLRRTRLAGWVLVVCFHVVTWVLFPIGVFPWVMIGATTVFFAPEWPRALRARLNHRIRGTRPDPGGNRDTSPCGTSPCGAVHVRARTIIAAWAWVAVLLALPLRHHLIPGDARWTGEGYRFSWFVLRAEKAGDIRFRVQDRVGGVTAIETAADMYTPLQWKVMATEPELIRQAAHAVADRAQQGGRTVAVYVDAFVSLNGRRPSRIIDPTVDLSREPFRFMGQPWILPRPGDSPP